ncbi:MAG: ABC transporter ATP-binding protein [Gemmatimonadaceae bacterium]|jgi:simple sugar transport system ATP-binding protein|nr:ABC transporter ATP-binding protein [Gemmatimonadaceae bacterium]
MTSGAPVPDPRLEREPPGGVAVATDALDDRPVVVRLTGIAKAFGAVQANRDASLEVRQGEIHALVGENGAGKSTLMKILGGLVAPDAGRVEVNGRDVTGWKTSDAIAAGVGVVHQHFMLVPPLSVAENIVLGQEPRGAGGLTLDRTRAVADVHALVTRTGLAVPANARVAELSVGEAQRVEILKALYRGAKILVLDEPTAVLSPPEVRELWRVLRTLVADGGTVILITHKLDEVIAISDGITVMRAGATVDRLRTADTTPQAIARAMVGRDVALALDHAPPPTRSGGAAVAGATDPTVADRALLSVTNVRVTSDRGGAALDGVSFAVHGGEILGIAGVEGNGQTELIEAIAGLRRVQAGTIRLGDRDITRLDVPQRAAMGLAHIPEDRHRRGLVLDYSIAENLILGRQQRYAGAAGTLDRARIAQEAAQQITAFDIRPADASLPARALSGGNQQKIVIAREMGGRADRLRTDDGGEGFRVLLAAQPTRGVDVGAIEFIHAQLRTARAAGRAIVLVSADLAEVLALADRVLVLYRGRVATELPRAACTTEVLGAYMTGASA